MEHTARESDIEAVFDQLREVSRRSNARSRSIEKTLSFVEDSLLRFIATTDGARATDIAAAFSLNRSTVSRQINSLISLGLVRYQDEQGDMQRHQSEKDVALDPAPSPPATSGRGRILELTESGEVQLATSTRVHQGVVKDRLSEWSDSEIASFAAALARYNAAEPTD
ncbi:MarR family winged helix-turn-helix transcriptional regulator [Arthrobacter sp. Sr24]